MLKNKTALITGGGSGIGRAIAIEFARQGAFSIVLDRNAEAAAKVAKEIEQEGGKSAAVSADVASSEQLRKAFDEIRRQSPDLHVLVNSAGIYVFKNAITADESDWDRCMDVDLKGAWLCAKQALPMMIASGGGSIINIASTHPVRAQGNSFPYGVAKGGMLSLTRNLAVDFGRQGVRVNTISPGLVFSPMTLDYLEANKEFSAEQAIALQPLPVRILPEDVARAALFLASDMARCITGANLLVDGGRTIHLSVQNAE